MSGPVRVRWRAAGTAEPLNFGARDEIAVRSTVAAAPGTPLEGELDAPAGDPLPLLMKVRRCRRQGAGGFVIEGRLVNPTKALREALARAVVPAAAGVDASEGGAAPPGPGDPEPPSHDSAAHPAAERTSGGVRGPR
jgi:hypothetical protein